MKCLHPMFAFYGTAVTLYVTKQQNQAVECTVCSEMSCDSLNRSWISVIAFYFSLKNKLINGYTTYSGGMFQYRSLNWALHLAVSVVTHQVVLKRGRKIDRTMNGLYLSAEKRY